MYWQYVKSIQCMILSVRISPNDLIVYIYIFKNLSHHIPLMNYSDPFFTSSKSDVVRIFKFYKSMGFNQYLVIYSYHNLNNKINFPYYNSWNMF